MTRLTQYSEAFWGSDFTSIVGYEALSKHNSDQRKFLRDLDEFLKQRGKIELEYSRSLGRLGETLKERTSLGSVDRTWNTLRMELEVCKTSHENAGLLFTQHCEETRRFCKEVTARRDAAEDKLKKMQSLKQQQHRNVMSLQKTYIQKCRDKDQCLENYSVIRMGVTSTFKDLEKAKTKSDKSDDEAAKADSCYKAAVNQLEETRQDWEREMELACNEFQNTDEEQITFVRTQLWSFVNKISETCVETDDSCERIRLVLEKCDIDQDVQSFIKNAATGTERPGPVMYQNYYDPGASKADMNRSPSSDHVSRPSSSDHVSRPSSSEQVSRPPLPSPPVINNANTALYSFASDSLDNDPMYSSVDPNYSSVDDTGLKTLTVIKSFQTPDFSVSPGERVLLVKKNSSNAVQVRTQSNRLGVLPITCIKESI